jgi:hypothetical protein|tara:strand:+ start:447 stop:1358 length:912 start_codon:yes stop_codon:yes gene_type:complete
MPDAMKFDPKDAKHDGDVPKTSSRPENKGDKKYLRHTPEERKGHLYVRRDVARDGTTTYYYGDGVKAIHHPDNKVAGPDYHNSAKEHHENLSRRALKAGKLRRAKAHGRAASGHDFAVSAQGGTPRVKELQKFLKEFAGGTVAVSSDPGVFTTTYGGSGGKKAKKKSKSGPQKLDAFLQRKSLSKMDSGDEDAVERFAIDIIKSASTSLMDNKKGTVEAKTFTGEAHYGDVSGYIPPADTTEDQKNNTAHRSGTETDVKKEVTLFDLIQAEVEAEDDRSATVELEKLLDRYIALEENPEVDVQ